MDLKDFLKTFNTSNPNWSKLPPDFPNCDLTGLDHLEIGKFLSIKGFWELAKPIKQPTQSSRSWSHPEGYKFLVQWSNSLLLRYLGRKLTDALPKSEYRRKAQLDDCLRSVVRNLEEGYKRSTTAEYTQFLGYSQGSLEEGKGDIKDLTQDRFLKSRKGSSLADLGIDLGAFNKALLSSDKPLDSSNNPLQEHTGEYRRLEEIYQPLAVVQAADLTYEMFLELINKTDFLLRKLVESLEVKLNQDHKGYQIDQLRLKRKIKGY